MKRLAAVFVLLAACEGHPGSAPLNFTLLTPTDGMATVSNTPTFTWTAAPRAESYRLQVALTNDFAAPTVDQPQLGATQFALTTPLADGTIYFWRVIATNEQGDTYTTPLSFGTQVTAGNPPAAFNLVEPANGQTAVALVPSFKWQIAPGADSYVFELASDVAFTTILINQAGLTLPSFSSPITLTANTQYFWRVTAVNVNGSPVAANAPFAFTTTP